MTDFVFWGASGQARVLQEALSSPENRLIAVFDNRQVLSPFPDTPIFIGENGFSVWAKDQASLENIRACVAIGGGLGFQRLALQVWLKNNGLLPYTVIHKTAFVAANSFIGEGSQILAMASVCANVRLGRSVIVNTAASIDHCSIVGDGCHVGPGARLAGEVELEANVFIGTGAVILPRIRIGEGAILGAGAIVTRDVAAGDIVVGNPARVMTRKTPTQSPEA